MKCVYIVVAHDPTDYEADPRLVCAYLEEGPANIHADAANVYVFENHRGQYNYAYDSPYDPEAKQDKVWQAPWYDCQAVELKGC
jgi:hypothetical protein